MVKPLLYLSVIVLSALIGSGCAKTDMQGNGTFIQITPKTLIANPGDSINFSILMKDSSRLSNFTGWVELNGNFTNEIYIDLVSKQYLYNFGYKIPIGFSGQITILAEAMGSGDEVTATAIVNVPGSNVLLINTFKSIVLGNYDNPSVGSFLSTTSGTVYNANGAALYFLDIDLGFFIGVHTLTTLAAPADSGYGLHKDQVDLGVVHWPVRHRTIFFNAYVKDFDLINTPGDIEATYYGYPPYRPNNPLHIGFLEKNMIVGFYTDSGKMGLIKIIDISTGANSSGTGTMTIDMKVEK